MKYLVSLDLSKNELLQAVVQNLAAAPGTPSAGQIYFDTVLNVLRFWDGTQWVSASGYTHPIFTDTDYSSTGANVLSSIVITNGHIESTANRILTLADLGYTGATDANNYAHPTFGTDPWLGITHPLTGVAVISDITITSEGHVTDIDTRNLTAADIAAIMINDAATSTTTTYSSTKIQNELDAINSAIVGALVYQGGYNAATNVPNLETPTGGTVFSGYTYTVTVAGTFFSEDLQIGDMIIAEINDPAALADWTLVNKNIPDIVAASETVSGIIELATQAEVDAGTDVVRAVTPATLAGYISTLPVNTFTASVGNGAATSFPLTHNLGTLDVNIQVYENATGDTVIADTTRDTINQATVSFNVAPTANQFRVIIKD